MIYTPLQYVESATDIIAKINRLNDLIDLLLENSTNIIENSGIAEYDFDDSQVKIKTVYRSASDLTKDIFNLQKLRETYINQVNGRQTISRNINNIYQFRR